MDTLPPVSEPKKRGCFFYGCLTFSVITLIALLFAGSGLYFAYTRVSSGLDKIADSKPADLSVEMLPKEELEKLNARITRFLEASAKDTPTEPLVLTASEINSLIQSDERLAPLKNRFKIDLEGDRIKASVSIPLDLFKRPNEYFNGVATIRFVDGPKGNQLFIEELESKGMKVPESVITLLRATDLLAEARKDPDSRKFLEQVDRIQIRDGRIILFGKAAIAS